MCVLADTLLLQRNRRPGLRLKLPSTVNPIEDGFDTSGSTDKDILFHSADVRAVVALSLSLFSGFSSGFSPVQCKPASWPKVEFA